MSVEFPYETSQRYRDHGKAGGGELYRLGLPLAQFLRLTLVDCEPEADAFFPAVDWSQWRELRRETPERGPKDECGLVYVDYRRI